MTTMPTPPPPPAGNSNNNNNGDQHPGVATTTTTLGDLLVSIAVPVCMHVAFSFGLGLLWNASLASAFGAPSLAWHQALALWTLFLGVIIIPAIVIIRLLPAVKVVLTAQTPVGANESNKTPEALSPKLPSATKEEEEGKSNNNNDDNTST